MCCACVDARAALGDTKVMHLGRTTVGMLLLLAVAACHSEPDAAGGGGRGAGSGSGAGGMGAPLPPRTPGGDTSDLGASGRGCWGDNTDSERVSLDDARARGLDPDALLAPIEGVFEADVRWLQLSKQPRSRVRLELTRSGTATIVGWDCKYGLGPSCYAGSHLLIDMSVAVSTDDGRLRGSFVTTLDPTPVKGLIDSPRSEVRVDEAGDVLLRFGSDAASVLGTLKLPKPDPMTTPSASFELLIRPDDEPLVSIRLLVADASQGGHAIDAWPLDGCRVDEVLAAGANGCSPPAIRTANARFGAGLCCATPTAFRDMRYPIAAGTDRACLDADGGMRTLVVDGGGIIVPPDAGTN